MSSRGPQADREAIATVTMPLADTARPVPEFVVVVNLGREMSLKSYDFIV